MAIPYKLRRRHADYYLSVATKNIDNFRVIDAELGQIKVAIFGLSQRDDLLSAQSTLEFVHVMSKFLKGRSLNSDLLTYCDLGLRACEKTNNNKGWLFLLRCEAHYALGSWDKSVEDALNAVIETKTIIPEVYARATLALGRIQFNRGEYTEALSRLSTAQELCLELNDMEGVATVRAEIAAYYLNRGKINEASRRYLEVAKMREDYGLEDQQNHSLLMLGVICRRQHKWEQGEEFLVRLYNKGKVSNDPNAMATAEHHRAWIRYDQRCFHEAQELGNSALQIYKRTGDMRGMSDAYEQLGMIELEKGNINLAQIHLENSLILRNQIANQHGVASSLRRLAMLCLSSCSWIEGFRYLVKSIKLYKRLEMLSLPRIAGIIIDAVKWSWRGIRFRNSKYMP